MNKRFLLIIASLLVVFSCSKMEEEVVETVSEPVYVPTVFHVSMEGATTPETRVYADTTLKVLWHNSDTVTIFNKNSEGLRYRFAGNTGKASGDLEAIDTEAPSGSSLEKVYAAYPHGESNAVLSEGTLKAAFPAVQHYSKASFGLKSNVMVSVGDNENLQFKNVGGYLCLKLYGFGVSVTSVKLKATGGEKIAGPCAIDVTGETPVATMQEGATDEITLVCDTPVQLVATSEWYKEFWFVVPPVTFSSGFTVTVSVAESASTFSKSTTKEFTVTRNNIQRMAPINVNINTGITRPTLAPTPVDLDLPSGVKWAGRNLGASGYGEAGYYFAWGEVIPRTEFTEGSYKWLAEYPETLSEDYIYTYINKYTCEDQRYTPRGIWYEPWDGTGYNFIGDRKYQLDLEDDAAHVLLGGKWRMPTKDEVQEMIDYTDFSYDSYCHVMTSSTNGNNIKLHYGGRIRAERNFNHTKPQEEFQVGYYWTSNLYTPASNPSTRTAYIMNCSHLQSGYDASVWSGYRAGGYNIRPVWDDNLYTDAPSAKMREGL